MTGCRDCFNVEILFYLNIHGTILVLGYLTLILKPSTSWPPSISIIYYQISLDHNFMMHTFFSYTPFHFSHLNVRVLLVISLSGVRVRTRVLYAKTCYMIIEFVDSLPI